MVAEGLGTFFLVFVGCGAIAIESVSAAGVAAAFGLAIMVSIYTFGHISGAHFNPAVTVALVIGRHFPTARMVPYWVAQCAGALVAAGALRLSLGDVRLGVTRPSGSNVQALAWEAILTFLLVVVIISLSTDIRAFRQAGALAIGGTVTLGSLVGGPISGASMNPARSLGPAIVSGDISALWVYLSAPFVGAILAALVYQWIRAPVSSTT